MAQENQSFERRLQVAAGGHRVFAALNPAEESVVNANIPAANIVGQPAHRGLRLGAYPSHHYTGDGNQMREYRIGPMLYGRNIQDAFDYYREGIKFAAPRCTYPPYPTLRSQPLEVVYLAGCAAAYGVTGYVGEATEAVRTQILGNVFAVGLPDAYMYTEDMANTKVLSGIRCMVQHLQDNVRQEVALRLNNPDWNTPNTADTTPADQIANLLNIFAVMITAQARQQMMSMYTGIFLAYTQQGNITNRKLNKITTEMQGQNIVITLTSDEIRQWWSLFGPFFDEATAADFFPYWSRLMQGRCLRLQLVFQQAANAGLTGLILVRTAITDYPDFRWDKLASKCGTHWARFLEAHRAVGDDVYYGFRKELGVVSVRNYAQIVFAAKLLHQTCGGDQNMQAVQTISTLTIPEAAYIRELVDQYARYKAQRIEGGDRVAAEAYFGPGQVPQNFVLADIGGERPADRAHLVQLLRDLGLGAPQPGAEAGLAGAGGGAQIVVPNANQLPGAAQR